ncbi:MAG: hypothetical protein ACK5TU_10940 [Cyclobacteriaceae bacterium]|jgi:hypothetical protein
MENEVSSPQATEQPLVTSVRPAKQFKQYFFEGLMIFLAVVLGSLAENLREYLSDREKEKEYMELLVSDLSYDIEQYDKVLQKVEDLIPMLDSLYFNIKHIDQFKYLILDKWNGPVNNSNVIYTPLLPTIVQLKNASNISLIQKVVVMRALLQYESTVSTNLLFRANLLNKAQADFYKMEDVTCDYDEFSKSLTIEIAGYLAKHEATHKKFTTQMKLSVTDENLKLQLGNSVVNYKGVISGYVPLVLTAKAQALIPRRVSVFGTLRTLNSKLSALNFS